MKEKSGVSAEKMLEPKGKQKDKPADMAEPEDQQSADKALEMLSGNMVQTDLFIRHHAQFFTFLDKKVRDIFIVADDGIKPKYLVGLYSKLSACFLPQHQVNIMRTPIKGLQAEQSALLNPTQAQERLLKVSSKLSIFKGLSDYEILRLTKDVRFLRYKKDEIVFNLGSYSDDIYVVISGSIDLYNNDIPHSEEKEHYLTTLGKGAVLGEIAPFTKENRSAKAITSGSENILLSFQIKEKEEGMESALNKLYKNVLGSIAEKLKSSNKRISV